MAPRARVIKEQLEMLISCIEQNYDMMKVPAGASMESSQSIRQKWSDLSKKLNSVTGGDLKNPNSWRKYWFEYRYKCKKKMTERKKLIESGDRSYKSPPLNELEIRVINIIDPDILSQILPEDGRQPKKEGSASEDENEFEYANNDDEYQPEIKKKRIQSNINNRSTNSHRDSSYVDTDDHKYYKTEDDEAQSVSPPPKWAIELEERRIAAQERMAQAVASMATVMKRQEERRAKLDGKIADALTAIAGTVQDLNSGVHEAVQLLQQLQDKHDPGDIDCKSNIANVFPDDV